MQAARNTRAHLSKVGMSTVLIQREVKKTEARLTKSPASDIKKGERYTRGATHGSGPVASGDRCNTAAWQEPGDPTRQTE